MAKHKFTSISLTVRDRAISSKFSTHRVSKECTLQFSKNSPLPKNGGHFEFLPKMAKHKIASISLTGQIERFRQNFRPMVVAILAPRDPETHTGTDKDIRF